MASEAYEGYALLELMGHRKRVGRVSEVEAYGGKLLRIDVLPAKPEGEVSTEYYGAASIYGISPVAEDVARDIARRYGNIERPRPATYALSAPVDRRDLYGLDLDQGDD